MNLKRLFMLLFILNTVSFIFVAVIVNKYQKLRGLTDKMIIGGLSSYNDPAMTYMTELFNNNVINIKIQHTFFLIVFSSHFFLYNYI